MSNERKPRSRWLYFAAFLVAFSLVGNAYEWITQPTVEELAEVAKIEAEMKAKAAAKDEESRLAMIKAKESIARSDDTKRAKIAASLLQFQRQVGDVSAVRSTATTEYGELVIEVANSWHYEPQPIRLQMAQMIGQIWKRCDTVGSGDFTIIDVNGNEVGGRGFSGVWVRP